MIGMAFGGWISGAIFDWTGSYQAAFINGVAWNMLNLVIGAFLIWRMGRPHGNLQALSRPPAGSCSQPRLGSAHASDKGPEPMPKF